MQIQEPSRMDQLTGSGREVTPRFLAWTAARQATQSPRMRSRWEGARAGTMVGAEGSDDSEALTQSQARVRICRLCFSSDFPEPLPEGVGRHPPGTRWGHTMALGPRTSAGGRAGAGGH